MTKSKFSYRSIKHKLLYHDDRIGNGVSADFNNDGNKDIIYSLDIYGSIKSTASPVGIFINTDRGFEPFMITIDGKPNQWPDVKFGMYTVVDDINQDGIPDIIPIDQTEVEGTEGYFEGNYQYAYISTGIGSYQKIQIGNDKYNVHGWGIMRSADNKFRILFNTPWSENYIFGISTVISTYDKNLNKFDSQYISATDPYYANLKPERHKEFFYQSTIDLNNDGNTDIVGFSSFEHGMNSIYLNDGIGNFTFYKHFSTGLGSRVRVEEIVTGDFDGNRLQDMVIMGVDHSSPTYKKTLRVLINQDGEDFVDKTSQYLGDQYQNIESSWGFLDSYDVNQDNLTDFTWNHWDNNNHTGNTLFDVFASTGSNFEVNTISNFVRSRTIPLDDKSLYDGHNIITLNYDKEIDVDKITCKFKLERHYVNNYPIIELPDTQIDFIGTGKFFFDSLFL